MKKRRAQGSLEYLIITAAVLAISAVVVLFLTGAFSSIKADTSACKQAAATCKNKMATTINPPCSDCETACKDSSGKDVMSKTMGCGGACILCKQGAATKIGGDLKILLYGPDGGTLSQLRTSLNEMGFKYTDKAGTWTYVPTDDELRNHDIKIHFTDCWSTQAENCAILKKALSYGKAVMLIGNDNSPPSCDLCVIGKSFTSSCGVVSSESANHLILSSIPVGSQLADNGADSMNAGLADNAQAVVLGKCANTLAALAVRTDMKVVQINAQGNTNAAFLSNAIWYLFA